jgi:hypothetical protein
MPAGFSLLFPGKSAGSAGDFFGSEPGKNSCSLLPAEQKRLRG